MSCVPVLYSALSCAPPPLSHVPLPGGSLQCAFPSDTLPLLLVFSYLRSFYCQNLHNVMMDKNMLGLMDLMDLMNAMTFVYILKQYINKFKIK
jgi:hypothetical protein